MTAIACRSCLTIRCTSRSRLRSPIISRIARRAVSVWNRSLANPNGKDKTWKRQDRHSNLQAENRNLDCMRWTDHARYVVPVGNGIWQSVNFSACLSIFLSFYFFRLRSPKRRPLRSITLTDQLGNRLIVRFISLLEFIQKIANHSG